MKTCGRPYPKRDERGNAAASRRPRKPVAAADFGRDSGCYRLSALLLLGALFAACGTTRLEPAPPSRAGDAPRVYLLGQGWHAGLIIERDAGTVRLWPERGDFPEAEFVEVGWGEREFYQAADPGVWMAVKAALWPSPSVVFMSGLRSPPESVFVCSDLIALDLSPARMERLLRYVHDSFDRTGSARTAPLPVSQPASWAFYPARGDFHLFNTCNTWTAGALAAAGYPLDRPYPLTAGGLVERVRPWGRILAPRALCFRPRPN